MSAVTMSALSVPVAKVSARGRVARHQLGATPAQLGKGNGVKVHMSRWKGMDEDISDDQQDIARGRGMVDSKFQGGFGLGGTANAVMSSSDYVSDGFKDLSKMKENSDEFYISETFMDKITVHIAKNFMDLPRIKVPLILGVWGGKGQGKTFQTTLVCARLGVQPIIMSAGELESGNAGEPAKLIRQRYREASDIVKKGRMSTLFINDLDAGAGRMGGSTQYTVNNQMVNATLMNLADNPTNVQLPGQYQVEEIPRVPVIATGNDFSTLYAPLIRDGRMEKFYWSPTFQDRVGVACGIFKADGVNANDVEVLVRTFDGQSIDFFGALRARVYDDKVRAWIKEVGIDAMGSYLINPSKDKGKVQFEAPRMSLDILLQYGKMLEQEQENVNRVQLADAYLDGAVLAGQSGSSNTPQSSLMN